MAQRGLLDCKSIYLSPLPSEPSQISGDTVTGSCTDYCMLWFEILKHDLCIRAWQVIIIKVEYGNRLFSLPSESERLSKLTDIYFALLCLAQYSGFFLLSFKRSVTMWGRGLGFWHYNFNCTDNSKLVGGKQPDQLWIPEPQHAVSWQSVWSQTVPTATSFLGPFICT